jgi:hypothetical protein
MKTTFSVAFTLPSFVMAIDESDNLYPAIIKIAAQDLLTFDFPVALYRCVHWILKSQTKDKSPSELSRETDSGSAQLMIKRPQRSNTIVSRSPSLCSKNC